MTRIFLVGMPRSGTTLLQTWVMSTGDVTSFPETHIFTQLSTHRSRAKQALRNLWAWSNLYRLARRARFARWPRPFVTGEGGTKEAMRCLDATAQAAGHSAWLEKTPAHLHEIALIRAFVPGAKFLVLHRGAINTVASLEKAEAAWHPHAHRGGFDAALARWLGDRGRIALLEDEGAPDTCIVTYEEILEETAQTAQKLGAFLDIPADHFAALDTLQSEAGKVVLPEEAWKARNLGQATGGSVQSEETVRRVALSLDAIAQSAKGTPK